MPYANGKTSVSQSADFRNIRYTDVMPDNRLLLPGSIRRTGTPAIASESAVICGNNGGCGIIFGITGVLVCGMFIGPAGIGCGIAAVL